MSTKILTFMADPSPPRLQLSSTHVRNLLLIQVRTETGEAGLEEHELAVLKLEGAARDNGANWTVRCHRRRDRFVDILQRSAVELQMHIDVE
jgi:hypothetical protein